MPTTQKLAKLPLTVVIALAVAPLLGVGAAFAIDDDKQTETFLLCLVMVALLFYACARLAASFADRELRLLPTVAAGGATGALLFFGTYLAGWGTAFFADLYMPEDGDMVIPSLGSGLTLGLELGGIGMAIGMVVSAVVWPLWREMS